MLEKIDEGFVFTWFTLGESLIELSEFLVRRLVVMLIADLTLHAYLQESWPR